jgi:hypothetical protein
VPIDVGRGQRQVTLALLASGFCARRLFNNSDVCQGANESGGIRSGIANSCGAM